MMEPSQEASPLSFGTASGESPDSRERAPRADVVRQPLLQVHVSPAIVLIGLRVRLPAAPVHAVFVGTIVPFRPRHDDASAFGQGLDLFRRERRIGRFRSGHSSNSVTGTPRARAKPLRLSLRRARWVSEEPRHAYPAFA